MLLRELLAGRVGDYPRSGESGWGAVGGRCLYDPHSL